jgi:hypothetical protein
MNSSFVRVRKSLVLQYLLVIMSAQLGELLVPRCLPDLQRTIWRIILDHDSVPDGLVSRFGSIPDQRCRRTIFSGESRQNELFERTAWMGRGNRRVMLDSRS